MDRRERRLVATLAPLGVTLWVTTSLLESSLGFAGRSQSQLEGLSRSLEQTGREFYQRARVALKSDAENGRSKPRRYQSSDTAVREFWQSGEHERFELAGADGDRLDYVVRHGNEVWTYSADIDVPMRRSSSR